MDINFFKDFFWTEMGGGGGGGSVCFRSSDDFFNRGLTMQVFRSCGTMPAVRDVLLMFVIVGKSMSRFS